MKIFDRCIRIQNFKKAFENMDLGHNTTWTEEGTTRDGLETYFGWQDPYVAVFFDNYYIYVYLQNNNGKMLVEWSYGDDEDQHGVEEFKEGEYDKVKAYVLNFMDHTEKEND